MMRGFCQKFRFRPAKRAEKGHTNKQGMHLSTKMTSKHYIPYTRQKVPCTWLKSETYDLHLDSCFLYDVELFVLM